MYQRRKKMTPNITRAAPPMMAMRIASCGVIGGLRSESRYISQMSDSAVRCGGATSACRGSWDRTWRLSLDLQAAQADRPGRLHLAAPAPAVEQLGGQHRAQD